MFERQAFMHIAHVSIIPHNLQVGSQVGSDQADEETGEYSRVSTNKLPAALSFKKQLAEKCSRLLQAMIAFSFYSRFEVWSRS